MDKWKSFFESSGSDIWTVIDRAITLAAVEQPAEMRLRRDKYTEKMFCPTSHLTGLCECDGGEAGNENETNRGRSEEDEDEEDDEDDDVSETKFVVAPAKVDRGEEFDEDEDEEDEDGRRSRRRRMELSDEDEEESPQIREVNRLKSRISNADEDDEYLCDALETLDRMQISVPTLKATVIGLPVNKLRKHSSSKVRAIAQRLISRWKALTDKHLTSKPVSVSNDDDYGLPSPPVDEGELLAAGNAPVEVTKLFDFFEDEMSDGSDMNEQPRRGGSGDWVNGIYEDAHSPQNNVTTNKPSRKTTDSETDRHNKPSSKKDTIKSSDSLRNKSGEGRLEKPSSRANGKPSDDLKDSRKTVTTSSSRPKPAAAAASTVARGAPPPKAKPAAANGFQKRGDDKPQQNTKVSLLAKNQPDGLRLAAAKRKLHEEYRHAENAKKQRTVQVMELTDLPKGKGGPKAVKAGPTKSHVQHNNRYRR